MKSLTHTLIVIGTLFGAALLPAADTKDTGVPASYPLKKCPVSGEDLGEMGKPVKVTHDGTDVYLCCKSCIKKFNADPAKFTAKVKEAQKK